VGCGALRGASRPLFAIGFGGAGVGCEGSTGISKYEANV
jgi:hypothetical protein